MELSCLHTHTSFCDGKGEIEDFCRAAIGKGFCSLGFSAHAPIEKKTGLKSDWNLKDSKLEEYSDAVRAAKKRWAGKLEIFLGFEADFIPGLVTPWDDDLLDQEPDYIIGSVHYIIPPKGAPFTADGSREELSAGLNEGYDGDADALVNAYWDSMESMIRDGPFDIVGHFDLIKKNNAALRLFDENDGWYRKRTAAAAGLIHEFGLTAEVNTGGINRGKLNETYPSLPILKVFNEKKIPAVINADAHKPEDLDGNYEAAIISLKSSGYTETVIFRGRKNKKAQWEKISLLK